MSDSVQDPKAPQEKDASPEDPRAHVARLFGLPSDHPLFEEATTHPSLANEQPGIADNQRLEFLGDSVLGFCISEILFARFPGEDEGALTRLRSQLVNAESLARWGMQTPIPEVLRLGKGADENRLKQSVNVIADAVEALIAAAYLHSGLPTARNICLVIAEYGLQKGHSGQLDAKSELQERVQALGAPSPTYLVLETSGPAHQRWFRIQVCVGGEGVGFGEGRSKRDAERSAARDALDSGRWELAAPSAPAASLSTSPDER
ncbi:MAG: ribonuclease III [Polyangiaceae bacterium]|nr:ribonuclease III [Polyangiaceae bacterium]